MTWKSPYSKKDFFAYLNHILDFQINDLMRCMELAPFLVAVGCMKEAINYIQDDFEKILVITHIEELKDAFPTRIDIIKTAEGSTISVS